MPRTALIVLDMQNAFLAEGGSLARRGESVAGREELVPAVNELLRRAARSGLPVILTRVVFDADAAAATPLQRRLRADGREHEYFPHAFDAQLAPELEAGHDARVVDKGSYDPFQGTGLEHTLREEGVGTLLLAGVLTNVCVESCARSAFERGFEVIVVEDATATWSAAAKHASLSVIARSFGRVLRLADLDDGLSVAGSPDAPMYSPPPGGRHA